MALNFANNNSLSAITAKPSGLSGGSFNLISTQTASGSANINFTSGIDSTYKEYIFKLINIHPATDNTHVYLLIVVVITMLQKQPLTLQHIIMKQIIIML